MVPPHHNMFRKTGALAGATQYLSNWCTGPGKDIIIRPEQSLRKAVTQ